MLRSVSLALGSLVLVALTFARAEGQIACGDVIPPGTTVVLTADVGPCTTATGGVTVDPARLDLNGFTVFCDDPRPDGITVTGRKAVLENGSVVGCDDGVVLTGTSHHRVRRVSSSHNDSDGFQVESDRNRLSHCAARANGVNGFRVTGERNALSDSTATENEDDGIDLEADDNRVRRCFSIDNEDDGIHIEARDCHVAHNFVGENDDEGIRVEGDRNVVSRNTCVDNSSDGIDVEGERNAIRTNFVAHNDEDGIDLDEGALNRVTNNTALDNASSGIEVSEGVTDTEILRNIASGNDTDDLEDENADCDDNRWRNNVGAVRTQPCVL